VEVPLNLSREYTLSDEANNIMKKLKRARPPASQWSFCFSGLIIIWAGVWLKVMQTSNKIHPLCAQSLQALFFIYIHIL